MALPPRKTAEPFDCAQGRLSDNDVATFIPFIVIHNYNTTSVYNIIFRISELAGNRK